MNLGASASRNRGLGESAAEYVHFLDDDVVPYPDLLIEAEKIICDNPQAIGFVGNSCFPIAESVFTTAVHLSGVTYFWDIAKKAKSHFPGLEHDIPWGVTANLIVRRNMIDNILFGTGFPKTGGGEDIDYCFQKCEFALRKGMKGFTTAPDVIITHPWWREGARSYWKFYTWAKGDGGLIQIYPQLTYTDYFPNSAELLFFTMIGVLLGALHDIASCCTGLVLLAAKLLLAIAYGNIAHDLYRQ